MELKSDNLRAQLNSFGDIVINAPKQLKQKLYTGPRTKDVVVDGLKNKFDIVFSSTNHLIDNCHKFESSIKSLIDHFQCILTTIETIYSVTIEDNLVQKDLLTLIKRFEMIRNKIQTDMPLFEKNVIEPVTKLHGICTRIQKAIENRDYLLYSLDSLKHKLNGLTPQKLATPGLKYEQEKMRIENRCDKAMADYQPINKQLRIELEVFFQLAEKLFQNWFLNHYYITYSFYYNMYTFIGSCSEVRRIVMDSNLNPKSDEFSPNSLQMINAIEAANENILAQFHSQFDDVSQELRRLGIVNFESFYERVTSNALNNITIYDSSRNSGEYNSSSIYCKAITDFQPSDLDSSNSLTLKKDDVIKIYRKETDVWWYGQCLRTNKIGFFPLQCTSLEKY